MTLLCNALGVVTWELSDLGVNDLMHVTLAPPLDIYDVNVINTFSL